MPHSSRHPARYDIEREIMSGDDVAAIGPVGEATGQAVNMLALFEGMTFPASKMELIAYAEDADASEDVMAHLQAMPDDIYNTAGDLDRHYNDIEIMEESGNLWSSAESQDLPDESERLISDLSGLGRI